MDRLFLEFKCEGVAVNRLLVTYDWSNHGNLVSDGTFIYTYNSARRMVRAAGVTVTLVYTYTADGLRVAQSVASSQSVFSCGRADSEYERILRGERFDAGGRVFQEQVGRQAPCCPDSGSKRRREFFLRSMSVRRGQRAEVGCESRAFVSLLRFGVD